MMDVLYFVLGIIAVIGIAVAIGMSQRTQKLIDTLSCEHEWDRWSRLYEAGDCLVQDRYCDKCNVAEVHKVRVR